MGSSLLLQLCLYLREYFCGHARVTRRGSEFVECTCSTAVSAIGPYLSPTQYPTHRSPYIQHWRWRAALGLAGHAPRACAARISIGQRWCRMSLTKGRVNGAGARGRLRCLARGMTINYGPISYIKTKVTCQAQERVMRGKLPPTVLWPSIVG